MTVVSSTALAASSAALAARSPADLASQAPIPSVTAWPVVDTTPPTASHTLSIRGRSQVPMKDCLLYGGVWWSGGDVRQDAGERAVVFRAALDGERDGAGLGAAVRSALPGD